MRCAAVWRRASSARPSFWRTCSTLPRIDTPKSKKTKSIFQVKKSKNGGLWSYGKEENEKLLQVIREVEADLKITKLEDWYEVKTTSHESLRKFCAALKEPVVQILAQAYPHHEWLPWKFHSVPRGFWSTTSNQRAFFDWAVKQINPEEAHLGLHAWYKATSNQVLALGGAGLLQCNAWSLQQALRRVYPSHAFLEWRFVSCPNSFWLDMDNRRKFLRHFANQLGAELTDKDFWYQVNWDMISRAGGSGLLNMYRSSILELVTDNIPEVEFEKWKFHSLQWWQVK